MKNKIVVFGLSLWLISVLPGCDFQKKETTTTSEETQKPTETKAAVNAPVFNPESAYQFIAKQVNFGPRVPNSAAHKACGDFLIQQLRDFGAQVTVQDFEATAYDGKRLKLRNIIGAYNPEAPNRIVLAAHWDTRPFADKDESNPTKPSDGANDGASGVGVLLEIARVLQTAKANPGLGIDLILFDGEDYGNANGGEDTWCLGSQYWSKNKHVANYNANYGILLDMVGANGARFAREGYSMQHAPQVVENVWRTAGQLGYSNYFVSIDNGSITDDHVYMTRGGVPTIDIIDYDPTSPDGTFGKYHHRHTDNMSIIDKNTLKAVGQTLVQVIYNQNPI